MSLVKERVISAAPLDTVLSEWPNDSLVAMVMRNQDASEWPLQPLAETPPPCEQSFLLSSSYSRWREEAVRMPELR